LPVEMEAGLPNRSVSGRKRLGPAAALGLGLVVLRHEGLKPFAHRAGRGHLVHVFLRIQPSARIVVA